jgi:PAS domain S-box-containing protein
MTVGNTDEFHSVILDSINDGVFTVDGDWKITSFNRGAERITGVQRKEAIGRRCCDVFRASICEASCALRETLATGRPVVNKPIYILGVKGQRIPISISTAVFKDRRGKVIGGVETFRDLTLVEDLRKELERKHSFADIVGRSAAIRQVFELLPLLAESESTVLIHGASGTGKELFARAIHSLSRRKDHPFVAINCGALPDTLLESELFGYKAGAFTDARRDKPGRFALARGGTILLDEIGDISPAMQARLLRVLQEKVFEPLGSVESVATDVRVLAATHQDLAGLVEAGTFREDLFYRIHVVRLELPRLCQRREDIPLLTDHFVAKFNRLQGKDVVGVADEVVARLMEYDFPGNVRELENIIEHAFVLCRSGLIQMSHLPAQLRTPVESYSLAEMTGMTLAAAEQWLIRDALSKHQGNRTAAAKQLGIDASTLHRKIRSFGIDIPSTKTRKP